MPGQWQFVEQSPWYRGRPPYLLSDGRPGFLFAQGSYREALESFELALTLDPANPELLFNTGADGGAKMPGVELGGLVLLAPALGAEPPLSWLPADHSSARADRRMRAPTRRSAATPAAAVPVY